jgi:putative PIN family toxin of toxin-antitoxin system
MGVPDIVIDTNLIVSALRSRRGASHLLITLIDSGKFRVNVSVPLVLEYEDATKRLVGQIALTAAEVDDILDYICAVAERRRVFFLWRPCLKDPKDDMVLEVAVSGRCDFLVTYNARDFAGAAQFGIRVVTAREFLREIGELP